MKRLKQTKLSRKNKSSNCQSHQTKLDSTGGVVDKIFSGGAREALEVAKSARLFCFVQLCEARVSILCRDTAGTQTLASTSPGSECRVSLFERSASLRNTLSPLAHASASPCFLKCIFSIEAAGWTSTLVFPGAESRPGQV